MEGTVDARLAVLGNPIAHSRSPQLHRAAYERLGLPWSYSSIRMGSAGLQLFADSRGPEWRGFSCTMPLKEEAFRIASWRDPVANESGAVNTLLRLPDAPGSVRPRWAGYNTDVPGLAEAIRKAGMDVSHPVVLGAGATAGSAILALRRLGAQRVTVLARRIEAAQALAARFDGSVEVDGSVPLSVTGGTLQAYAGGPVTAVVSSLPATAGSALDVHSDLLRAALFDVAYDPWPSPLARRWEAAGSQAHEGLSMLIEQAILQLRIFVQGNPSDALPDEAALLADLYARGMGG